MPDARRKLSLAYVTTLQEKHRREAVDRFLEGRPRPGTATEKRAQRFRRSLERVFERWMHAAVDQLVDTMVYGTSVYKVKWGPGVRFHRYYPRKPFPVLWRWKSGTEPAYGRGPVAAVLDDQSEWQRKAIAKLFHVPKYLLLNRGRTGTAQELQAVRRAQLMADPPIALSCRPGQEVKNVGGIMVPSGETRK